MASLQSPNLAMHFLRNLYGLTFVFAAKDASFFFLFHFIANGHRSYLLGA